MIDNEIMRRKTNNGRVEVIKRLIDSGLPVVVYGTGKFARQAAEKLIRNGLRVMCFLDDDEYWFPGKKILLGGGVELNSIKRDMLNTIKESYNICVGFIDYRITAKTRKEFSNCQHVEYLDAVKFHNIDTEYFERHRLALEELYNNLQDSQSQKVMKEYLFARYSGDVSGLCELVYDKYMYDWELLGLCGDDIVIDGGAYTGDSVSEMIDYLCGEIPKSIYAFEPDELNRGFLSETVDRRMLDNVKIEPYGLSGCDCILMFKHSGEIGAVASEEGDKPVQVISLDNHPEYWDATIVKMDIEGSEVAALTHAEGLLKHHPRLAICVYHNNDDIVDIYKILKQYNYKFYLRQHSYAAEETVMYAL